MYIAEHLVFSHKKEFQSQYFQHIWTDVKVNSSTIAINAFYRPPNETQADHQHFLQTAENILLQLNNYKSAQYKIISSDLNFGNCYCKNPILIHKPLDSSAPDLFESFGFQQLVDIPTRVAFGTISLIDLIFTNMKENIVCHGTLPKIADHEGTIVCLNTKSTKSKSKSKVIYDYKNADEAGLIDYINFFNFDNTVFNQPATKQAEIFTNILQDAFAQFVPSKQVLVRPSDQSWCNRLTRLLLRKKNRNYNFYKKCELDYKNILKEPNPNPELTTKLLNKRNKAHDKARNSANESCKANRRAKQDFYNSVNNTLRNNDISAKKKFSILFKLMKNNKFTNIQSLIENNSEIHDPLEQSNIFNDFFASKSSVQNPEDPVPFLQRKEGIVPLNMINTSPIEIARIVRKLKRSHICLIVGFLVNSSILYLHLYHFLYHGYLTTYLK